MSKLSLEKVKYLKYSIQNKFLLDSKWHFDLFSYIVEDNYNDEYISKNGKAIEGIMKEDSIILSNNYKEPVYNVKDELIIDDTWLPNVKGKINTTVGRVIMNYLLLVYPFKSKIPYMNKQFTIKDIENEYIKKLLTDEETSDTKITIKEFMDFMDAGTFLGNLVKLTSLADTEKSSLPPEGIKEYREKLIKEYKEKYGEKALNDPVVVAEIEKKLLEYDDKYLKDDEAYGKLISGKVKNQARKRMFLMFGIGNRFDETETPHPITYSLEEGWKKDPKDLVALFNDSRAGSYGRGAETQQGGVVAKDTLRSTQDVKILIKDCGTKVGRPVTINESNAKSLINRHIIDNGKTILLTEENIGKYMNKTVMLRTPMYCHEGSNFCIKCMSQVLEDKPNAVSLMASGIGGQFLAASLKKFHATGLDLAEMDMDDIT